MKKDHEVLPSLGFLDFCNRNGEVLTYWTDDLSFLASCQIATQEINSGWWGVAQSIIFATELPDRASYVVSSLLTTICSRVTLWPLFGKKSVTENINWSEDVFKAHDSSIFGLL